VTSIHHILIIDPATSALARILEADNC